MQHYTESSEGIQKCDLNDPKSLSMYMGMTALKTKELLNKTDLASAPVSAAQKKAVADAAYGSIESSISVYCRLQGTTLDDPMVQETLAPVREKIYRLIGEADTLGELRAALRNANSGF